jgi:tRNA threonylcarbamoyladenosine modification (KEOPS) complex  Pcc1 subunit
MIWNSVRAFIPPPDLLDAYDTNLAIEVEEDSIVTYPKAKAVFVVGEGLDASSLRQAEQLSADRCADLSARARDYAALRARSKALLLWVMYTAGPSGVVITCS